MVNGDIIHRRLSRLREYVSALREAEDITWETYRRNRRERAFVERYLHLAIQTVFDIANHVIAFQGWKEPETYRETFAVLAEHGILPEENVSDFQRMAAFRNMLVHHYESVEDEVVFGIFRHRLEDFDRFEKCMLRYIKGIDKP